MRGFIRRLHRAPSSDIHDNGRQSRFNRTDRVLQKSYIPVVKPTHESPETPTHSRKRDRLRTYLARRHEIRGNEGAMPYYWSAMLSAGKEEDRSSNDTEIGEDGDDVYVVEYSSDSESDDDSLSEDNYVIPPVEIPDTYRRQDRLGGSTVAGARVLFTYAGFKRQQMIRVKLQSVSEI